MGLALAACFGQHAHFFGQWLYLVVSAHTDYFDDRFEDLKYDVEDIMDEPCQQNYQADDLCYREDLKRSAPVKYHEADVEEQWIDSQYCTVDFSLFMVEGDHQSTEIMNEDQ